MDALGIQPPDQATAPQPGVPAGTQDEDDDDQDA